MGAGSKQQEGERMPQEKENSWNKENVPSCNLIFKVTTWFLYCVTFNTQTLLD